MNTANEALMRAINKAIAEGAPVYINQPVQIGYDYHNQAWVVDGKYVACAHPASMRCNCYGTMHAGKPVAVDADVH